MKTGYVTLAALLAAALLIPGCPAEDDTPDRPVLSTSADIKPNNWERPMLWSVYEYFRQQEDRDKENTVNWLPEDIFRANVDWVDRELKPFGYNYIAIDGWGDGVFNEHGYKIKHDSNWKYTYKDWSIMLREKGLKLAMYDNPLWMQGADMNSKIQGTDYCLGDIAETAWAKWFKWVDVTRPGAEEYVKGKIRHWKDMGVDYLKVDFISWYETGYDENGYAGRTDRPREHYETALRWIREEADKQGVFISLAMANLMDYAELEAKYCHMIRISGDIWNGNPTSTFSGGPMPAVNPGDLPTFPRYRAIYDGFVYHAHRTGPGKVMLDGDYMWLNNRWNNWPWHENNMRAIVTLHVVAGGIVSLCDQFQNDTTTGGGGRDPVDIVPFYTRPELIDLVREGFIAKPLSVTKYPNTIPENRVLRGTSTNPSIDVVDENGVATQISRAQMENDSHVWWGRCKNGDYIVAMFNREGGNQRTRSINFEDMGVDFNEVQSFDLTELWGQEPPIYNYSLRTLSRRFSDQAEPMGNVRIYRLEPNY